MKPALAALPHAVAVCSLLCFQVAAGGADDPARIVATVNGSKVAQTELAAEFLVRRVPEAKQAALRDVVLNDLIDRRLIAAYLDQRKAPVPEPELEAQLDLLKRAVEAGGDQFAEVLGRRGLTEESLRAQLALPLRWKAYVRRTITDQQLRDYFESRRAEFDGTQVRARQIVISVSADAEEAAWAMAAATLKQVREMIVAGKTSFEEAARQHSTSPSGKQGGDLGFIGYRGRLPPDVAAAAFALKAGDVSEVIRSPFGVHLVRASERKPGDYSLEDVREQVWEQQANDLWNEQVATARKSAKIQIETMSPQ